MDFLSGLANAIGIGKWINRFLNPEPEIMVVDLNYPVASGLQSDLEKQNIAISWCNEDKVQTKIEREGYSKLFRHPKKNKPVILMVKTIPQNAILIQRKKT